MTVVSYRFTEEPYIQQLGIYTKIMWQYDVMMKETKKEGVWSIRRVKQKEIQRGRRRNKKECMVRCGERK
jgi:hypothetical protein